MHVQAEKQNVVYAYKTILLTNCKWVSLEGHCMHTTQYYSLTYTKDRRILRDIMLSEISRLHKDKHRFSLYDIKVVRIT